MNKQQQIEEMAKDIHRVCTDCSGEMFDEYTCDRCQAKLLIEKGYRKIPEDSIVLTETERITMCTEQWDKGFAQARKETAEKIYKLVDSKLDLYRNGVIGGTLYDRGYQIAISDIKQKIKDIFKVEIKE